MDDHQITIAIEALKLFLWGLLIASGLFSGTIIIALAVDFYRMNAKPKKGRRRMKKVEGFTPAVDGQTVVFELNQLRRHRQAEREEFFNTVQEMHR